MGQSVRNTFHSPSPSVHRLVLLALLPLLAWMLSSCISLTDTEGSQEQRQDVIAIIEDGQVFRQTFASRRSGFNRLELMLRLPDDGNLDGGYVTAELRRLPADTPPLASATFTAEQLKSSDVLPLDFPELSDSAGADYELRIYSTGGVVQVLGRLEDVYGEGSAILQEEYLLADAAWHISYEYNLASVYQDISSLLSKTGLIFAAGLVLFLSGWLLLAWSGLDKGMDMGQRVGIALGISLAVIPLVMAWTSLLGAHWNSSIVLMATGFLSAITVYNLWRRTRIHITGRARETGADLLAALKSGPRINFALWGVFLLALFVRTAMVRDLSAPPWVDSVHHALITRLILEQGALPQTYAPYIAINAASYHPGFHTVLAMFEWLTQANLPEGMLLFGQLLNALCVFSVYLFTTSLGGNRLAGLAAALAAGLFTPMPAYFTSWGRYTQLAALMILPAALVLTLRATKPIPASPPSTAQNLFPIFRIRWNAILLAGIAWAGLYLTHYRVAAFTGCLLIAYGVIKGAQALYHHLRQQADNQTHGENSSPGKISLSLLGVGAAAALLALPWLLPSLQELLLPRLSAWRPATPQAFDGVTWPYLNTAWGGVALWLAGAGFVAGLLLRKSLPLVLGLWVGMMFGLANLGMLGLPGSGFVNGISVTISLFLPIAALAGYFISLVLGAVSRLLPSPWRGAYRWILALMGVVFASLAARQLIPLLNPVTFLFRPVDRAGIEWVSANIAHGERVLVNPFAWGYGQYAGNDGGYWISAIGDHATFPPPVLYGLNNSPESIQEINQASQQVIDLADEPEALHTLLAELGIRYIYIGGRGGVLSAHALRSSPLYAPRYAQNGAFVFEVLP